MLRLPCPWCGTRDETEFHYGGESHISRPSPQASDAEWSDYLFNRKNPMGVHHERWCHGYGCGRWFNVARNTLTHQIVAVYRLDEPAPVLDAESSTENGS